MLKIRKPIGEVSVLSLDSKKFSETSVLIVAIGKELRKGNAPPRWLLVWLLMVGAIYSLEKAKGIVKEQRNTERKIKEAFLFLDQLQSGIEVNESAFSDWIAEYYINSCEMRLQSATDRLFADSDESGHLFRSISDSIPVLFGQMSERSDARAQW